MYDVPRLGFDFVLPRRFTLGLEVAGIASLSGSPSLGDPPKVSLFGIAPHVGYLAVLNRYVAAWLRAGAAYYETSSEGVNGAGGATVSYSWTWRQLDATVEGHMLFTPLPHVGVTVGVYGELPLHGSFEEERSVGPGVTANASSLELGVVAGILTYL